MAFNDPQQIVTPRGVLAFNGWGATDYMRIMQLNPAEGAPIRRETFPNSGRHGGVVGDGWDDILVSAFSGDIVANTAPIYLTRRLLAQNLKAYLHATERADATWKWLPAGANLIANGGFETDVSGWSAVTGGGVSRVTAQHQDGVASMQVTMTTTAGSGAVAATGVNQLVPGATYTLQAAVKRTVGSGNVSMQVDTFDVLGGALTSFVATIVPTGSFVVYTLTFVAPANADRFDVLFANASGVAQTIFIDAVKVEYGNTATVYAEPGVASYQSQLQRVCRVAVNSQVIPGSRLDTFNFAMACGDPIAYSAIQRTSADITFNGAAVNVLNAGDTETWPVIRLTGGITGVVVTNGLTGESISFPTLVVANGAYVDVDTRLGRATLSTDGSSVLGSMSIGTSTAWPLYPGLNSITATGSSLVGSPKANLIYRDAWSG